MYSGISFPMNNFFAGIFLMLWAYQGNYTLETDKIWGEKYFGFHVTSFKLFSFSHLLFQVFTSPSFSALLKFFNPRLVLRVLRKDCRVYCYFRGNIIQRKNSTKSQTIQSAGSKSYDVGHMDGRLSSFTQFFFFLKKPLPKEHLWILFLDPSDPWLQVGRIGLAAVDFSITIHIAVQEIIIYI